MIDIKDVLRKASVSELKKWQDDISREIVSRSQGHVPADAIVTFTDGASRGNPGLAGAGILLFNAKGEKIKEDCQFLGVCTNNEAEYRALIFALTYARDLTKGPLCCFLDSQLTVRQLNGEYALKSEKLTPFFHEVKNLTRYFSSVTFTHVPREHPQLQMADALANKGIDQAKKN